jgi:hypothetical protein
MIVEAIARTERTVVVEKCISSVRVDLLTEMDCRNKSR